MSRAERAVFDELGIMDNAVEKTRLKRNLEVGLEEIVNVSFYNMIYTARMQTVLRYTILIRSNQSNQINSSLIIINLISADKNTFSEQILDYLKIIYDLIIKLFYDVGSFIF